MVERARKDVGIDVPQLSELMDACIDRNVVRFKKGSLEIVFGPQHVSMKGDGKGEAEDPLKRKRDHYELLLGISLNEKQLAALPG